jgi:osmotically-inducible protein OsmY
MSGMNKDMATTEADKSLNSQIRQSMNADTSLANIGQNVHFSTQDGEVTLHGSVASETEKNQIEQKVKQVSDVKSVKNELQVSSVGSSSPTGSADR